jgi:hypothetical protein
MMLLSLNPQTDAPSGRDSEEYAAGKTEQEILHSTAQKRAQKVLVETTHRHDLFP